MCDLTVIFEKGFSDERDESWKDFNFVNFKGIILKGRSVRTDAAFSPSVTKYLKKNAYDHIIVANVATPTGMLAIETLRMRKIPYMIEGDGAFCPKTEKFLKKLVKTHFMTGAEGYFSTEKEHDRYYLRYGAKADRIYRYPFSSLREWELLENVPTTDEKKLAKEKLDIPYEKVILSVGQFIRRKGYDVLIHACRNVSPEVGIYIIGGTPTEEYVRMKEEYNLSNLHFIDFMKRELLADYYIAADLFALPTREDIWGLVINEAMAHGLPVVATDRCGAALELVEDDVNGYIVPVDDYISLGERINDIMNNNEKREAMSKASLEKIRNYTVENMAEEHIRILNKL